MSKSRMTRKTSGLVTPVPPHIAPASPSPSILLSKVEHSNTKLSVQPRKTNVYLQRRTQSKHSSEDGSQNSISKHWGRKLRAAASDGRLSDVIEILEDAKYRKEDDGLLDTNDRWGFTALIEASMFGHVSVVEILLHSGANISHKTKAGETA